MIVADPARWLPQSVTLEGGTTLADAVPLIPHDVLFGSTEVTSPVISPDGRLIAFVGPRAEVANLFVREVGSDAARPLTEDRGRGIHTFRWAPDSSHLIYEQDVGGDENWQLLLCDVDSGATRPLVAMPGVRAQILGTSKLLPDTLCVGLNADDPRWHDVHHVSLSSGEQGLVAKNPGFTRWVVDHRLRPLGGVRTREDGAVEVVVRADEASDWRTVLELDHDDAFQVLFDVFPMRLSADGRSLYLITSQGFDTTRVVRVDLATGAVEAVAGDPGGDVLSVEFHPDTHHPQLAVVPIDRSVYIVCDPAFEEDFEAVRGLHEGDVGILSRDDADRRWTLEFTRDAGSRAYFVYDRDRRGGELLFYAQPELEEFELAAMEPFSYRARDGLKIPGYLSFPPGAEPGRLPTVVLLHGGPADRYFWGYQPLVQLLTNRGYLVVQPNFRGSLGYGKNFFAAGTRQWARAMHHDVVDAIDWVAAQGYADRSRIGLWGGSYGGYETLVAVTHDPGLVACAVAQVAPVNLVTLMRSIPPYWRAERDYLLHVVGDPETEEAELWDRSPLRLADRIAVPLLLFYGEQDPRVPVAEAEQLTAALKRNGIAHELHIIPDEGHSLGTAMSPEHRDLYVAALERFYAAHLGGRTASVAATP